MDAPKRRYQMTFTVGADSLQDMDNAQDAIWLIEQELENIRQKLIKGEALSIDEPMRKTG